MQLWGVQVWSASCHPSQETGRRAPRCPPAAGSPRAWEAAAATPSPPRCGPGCGHGTAQPGPRRAGAAAASSAPLLSSPLRSALHRLCAALGRPCRPPGSRIIQHVFANRKGQTNCSAITEHWHLPTMYFQVLPCGITDTL